MNEEVDKVDKRLRFWECVVVGGRNRDRDECSASVMYVLEIKVRLKIVTEQVMEIVMKV